MRLALAIASLVILAVHGWVFFDQFFHRWERHQTAYFDQAQALSKNAAERQALAGRRPRIEQVIVTQFGEARVDRCQTCHIAMDDPRFLGHAQPLKTHPYSAALGDFERGGRWERRHKFANFGCTVCHDGQGRGLKTEYSHGEDHYWPDPLLGYVTQHTWVKAYVPRLTGKEYLEANCAQCHTEENFAGTQWVQRGRKLFYQTNCWGCHRIEGLSDGTLGPDLTESGKKFKLDYLWESIVDPRANSAVSFMPKFKLADDDVKALVIFLKSRKGRNFAETEIQRYQMRMAGASRTEAPAAAQVKPAAGAPLAAQGEKLIKDHACLACHKIDQTDGGVAPDLSWAGLMRTPEWIYDHFRDPRALVSDSIMPAFRFPDEDFRAMTAYLVGRKTAPPAAAAPELYKALCARCHGDKGDGHGPIAVYLDPYPRDLTKAAFITSKPRERLVDAIKHGVAGTSMPPWGQALGGQQVEGLLDHVLVTYTKEPLRAPRARKIPERNPVAMNAQSVARGEEVFVRRCSGCHGRKADGKGPNSVDILPRPRNLRNTAFVQSISDQRMFESILYGVQGTAMPPWIDYGMSANEVGDIVNFIRSVNPGASPKQTARTHHARRETHN